MRTTTRRRNHKKHTGGNDFARETIRQLSKRSLLTEMLSPAKLSNLSSRKSSSRKSPSFMKSVSSLSSRKSSSRKGHTATQAEWESMLNDYTNGSPLPAGAIKILSPVLSKTNTKWAYPKERKLLHNVRLTESEKRKIGKGFKKLKFPASLGGKTRKHKKINIKK
jgi:hypothetical protein